jgi:hypothetical protein
VDGVPTGGGGGGEEVVVVVLVWWRRRRSHGRWPPPSAAAPPPPPDPASNLAHGARRGQASHPVGLLFPPSSTVGTRSTAAGSEVGSAASSYYCRRDLRGPHFPDVLVVACDSRCRELVAVAAGTGRWQRRRTTVTS